MLLAVIYILVVALLGTTLAVYYRVISEKISAAAIGLTAGVSIVTTIIYALQILFPFTLALLLVGLTVCLGISVWYLQKGAWQTWLSLPADKTAAAVLGFALIITLLIAPKLLILKDDGLYTGIINAYGDIAWHTANITAFTAGQSTPPANPIFAGTALVYPFMTNFLSAILVKTGSSLTASVNIVSLVMMPALLVLLYHFARQASKKRLAAAVAVLLFLFGGAALGWVRIGSDFAAQDSSLLGFLLHLPNRDYSGVGTDQQGFHFLNPVTSLLLPQRSFLLAFPLALSILILLFPDKQRAARHFIFAGILSGLLPLFHAHTILALVPAIISLFLLDGKKIKSSLQLWLLFILAALIVGIPEVLYYVLNIQTGESFLRWGPGWMAGDINIIWYWFLNTGLIIPAIIIGLGMRAPRVAKALAVAGLSIFFIANLFLFAPWAWDNFKLFIYFLIFSLPLIGYVAIAGIQTSRSLPVKALIIVILGGHIASAVLDITKLALPTAPEWMEWSRADIVFAKQVQQTVAPRSSILTAPTHNSAIVLSGRPRYLGYSAHAWSHGLNPWDREKAIKEVYEGRLKPDQLPEHTPDYIAVTPQERAAYKVVIQPDWQLVAAAEGYQLYRPAPFSQNIPQ